MLKVYGVVPMALLGSTKVVAEFPAFSGRPAGGPVPADCAVGLVDLPCSAGTSTHSWTWMPAASGYVVLTNGLPCTELKNHLRNIRQLTDEQGCKRPWPWFDPRYLKRALTLLQEPDLYALFGPVQGYAFAAPSGLEIYSLQAGQLSIRPIAA